MPILGIMASAMSANLWQPQGAYDALSTVTVPSGGVASITFAAIPTGYKHLQVRGIAQSNRGTFVKDDLGIQVNGDTGSNYAWHVLTGNGSTAAASATASTTNMTFWDYIGTQVTFSKFGGFVIDILDYSSINKNKTFRGLGGTDANGSGSIGFNSGLWMNASTAINTISLYSNTSSTLQQHTQFTLYGVK